jgi:hypothetical protein
MKPSVILAISLLAFAAADAQSTMRITPPRIDWIGDSTASHLIRVRIADRGATRIGTFVSLSADSLVLFEEINGKSAIALRDINSLEQGMGTHRNMIKGTLYGFVIGATVGTFIGAVGYTPCQGHRLGDCLVTPTSRTEAAEWGAILGGIPGVLVGFVAGALTKTEDWFDITGHLPMKVSVTPARGAFALRASIAF